MEITHMDSLPTRLAKLADRLMATTEHHQYAQLVLEAAAEIRRAVPEGDARDAARYRFIRHPSSATLEGVWAKITEPDCNDEAMDSVIDAAMCITPQSRQP
jgi:hypothetical protein